MCLAIAIAAAVISLLTCMIAMAANFNKRQLPPRDEKGRFVKREK